MVFSERRSETEKDEKFFLYGCRKLSSRLHALLKVLSSTGCVLFSVEFLSLFCAFLSRQIYLTLAKTEKMLTAKRQGEVRHHSAEVARERSKESEPRKDGVNNVTQELTSEGAIFVCWLFSTSFADSVCIHSH